MVQERRVWEIIREIQVQPEIKRKGNMKRSPGRNLTVPEHMVHPQKITQTEDIEHKLNILDTEEKLDATNPGHQ